MIHVIDVGSVGVQHEQFNASILRLLRNNQLSQEISFYGDKSHSDILKNNCNNIDFKNISLYKKRGGLKEFIRAYVQFASLRKIIHELGAINNNDKVLVLLIHPFAHFLFKYFIKCDQKITFVLHGELESLKFNKHTVNKIWGYFLQKALSKINSNISYIVLGGSISDNLVKILPSFKNQKYLILDHPYPFEYKKNRTLDRDGYLTFSSIGVASVHKNSHYLFLLAEKISKLGLSNKCRFQICGRTFPDMLQYLNNHVEYKSDFGFYTREQINQKLEETSFSIFYYSNYNYSLCSSGAFWDAINAETPLLYVKNDYFIYYEEKVGKIGVKFDSAEELNEFVIDGLQNGFKVSDYEQYVKNIQTLKFEYMNENRLSLELYSFLE